MTSFDDLGLAPKVLQAVAESGYKTPTPIQAQAIPYALQGRDVLGIAQTGTGKTASFTLPMITMLSKGRARARMPRSLVLCPTRELAAQVAKNFESYAKHMKLSMALLIGGVSFKDQDRLIDRGVDVLIATPGRLLDHFERGKLMLNGVQIMVIDEADRMLDMGFIPDIERIFKLTPFTRQTLFFSATMAPEITRITNEFLHNPVRVEVARQASTSETITQSVCMVTPSRKDRSAKDKRDTLRALIDAEGESLTNAIIFCNRKRDVDIVANSLKKHGLDASALHGDLDQSQRTKILNGFRDGELKLLVASDVAARGLDIPNVSHIFNFDVPIHSEDYVHRIGRTGRAGRSGKAITLCLPFEGKFLASIEDLVKKSIPRIENPLNSKTDTKKVDEKPVKHSRPDRSAKKPESSEEKPAETQKPATHNKDNSRSDSNRRSQRGRGGRGRDNGPSPVGMGDHMPAFMTRDLRALQEAAAQVKVEEKATDIIEEIVKVKTVETPVEEKPNKSRRRAPKKKVEETPVTDVDIADAPDADNATDETPASEEVVAEKPAKKPRKRRVTKKKEEPTVEEPTSSDTPQNETSSE